MRKIGKFEAIVQVGNRIVIPADIREELEIKPGDCVRVKIEKVKRIEVIEGSEDF